MDECTAAQALRSPSGPSRWVLPRRWSSQTNREVMEDSRGTTKAGPGSMDEAQGITEDGSGTIEEGLAIMEKGPEIVVGGLGTMEEGQGITDTTTQTRSPTCC